MPSPTMSEADVMSAFAQDCVDIYRDWQREAPARRRSAIQDAIRTVTRSTALPDFAFFFKKMDAHMNGHFDAQNWRLDINSLKSDVHGLTQADFVSFCSVLYHEARHGEQWYRCAQGVLAGELTNPWLDGIDVRPAHIASTMYFPLQIIQHAEARGRVSWNKYKVELPVGTWFDSVWGANRVHRGNVLTHLQTMYVQYRALPEEVDAWNTQFAVEALINPLLAGVAQHVVEAADPVSSLRDQHAKVIGGPSGLEAQLKQVKLKHVVRPESSGNVGALAQGHVAKMADASKVGISEQSESTGFRVRELVKTQNNLIKQLAKSR